MYSQEQCLQSKTVVEESEKRLEQFMALKIVMRETEEERDELKGTNAHLSRKLEVSVCTYVRMYISACVHMYVPACVCVCIRTCMLGCMCAQEHESTSELIRIYTCMS